MKIYSTHSLTRGILFFAFFCAIIPMGMGCASSSMTANPHHTTQPSWAGTAILLDYDLLQVAHQSDCTLVFTNLGASSGANTNYEVTLPNRAHQVLVDLPAGTYIGKTLNCDRLHSWDLNGFLKGRFTIASGKINYLGKVIFRLNEDQSALDVHVADPEELTNAVHSDFEHFPSQWIQALYNPFTSRPIDAQAIAPQKSYDLHFHTSYVLKPGEKSGPSTKGLEASVDECEIREVHVYPYRLGTLTYTATYEGQKLLELKKDEHDSFSDVFTSCLEQSFNNFVPVDDTHFTVIISI